MSKIAQYLQEHLLGEVTTGQEVRRQLAHDASVLRLVPAIAVYPRDETDVRKTARFCWQLAQRGRVLPITARGGGSSTSGAAIGKGISLVMPAHLNRILSFNPRKHSVTVEPGITYDKLNQTLYTHGLFLPAYPSSSAFATLGGGIASNAVGEKSHKYGDTRHFVKALRVVLANGEVIETGPLDKKAHNRKLGLSTMEGQIYRALDALLEDEAETIARFPLGGYSLVSIKKRDSFDLTPLFVGSEGTLGIITEATLEVSPHNPETTLALIGLEKLSDLEIVLPRLMKLKPSVLDMVSRGALQHVAKLNPNQLKSSVESKTAAIHLLVEFDDLKASGRKHASDGLRKLINEIGGTLVMTDDLDEQQTLRKVRESVATLFLQSDGTRTAVPLAEDIQVPTERLTEFLSELENILAIEQLPTAWWGHAGAGIVRLYPQLDLEQLGDRQSFFKLSDKFYKLAVSMGGSLSASGANGRVRAPFAAEVHGEKFVALNRQVKKIFDPFGLLNPGIGETSLDDLKATIHGGYTLAHRQGHLPRS